MAKKTPKEETKPAPIPEPTFLKEVAEMSALAEEAIRKLRTEVHPDDFQFKDLDLSALFPQRVASLDELEQLEGVVGKYLLQTKPSGLRERDLRAENPLENNISHYHFTAQSWMAEVYTARKAEIDQRVAQLGCNISDDANQRVRDLTWELGQSSKEPDRFFALVGKPELPLESLLAGSLQEIKTRMYETELPQPEALALLYELCFKSVVEQKGWNSLADEELLKVLEAEMVPLELFHQYTEREIKPVKKKAGKGSVLEVISSPAPAAATRTETAALTGQPKEYHFISAQNYFAALEQLRQDCANAPNSLQPTIIINGQIYVRPLTVRELLRWRLENYNTLTNPDYTTRSEEERKKLLTKWFFTADAIDYLGNGNTFKLVQECPQLITLDSVPAAYLDVDYSGSPGKEFSRTQRGVKYNQSLTEEEVVAHPAWRELAGDDDDEGRRLLQETHKLLCSLYRRETGMGFYLIYTLNENQRRALALDSYYYYSSSLGGGCYFGSNSSFLRVARRGAP